MVLSRQAVFFTGVMWVYQFVRALRYVILHTLFGFVSHCQQTPSCGTFFLKTVKSKGLLKALSQTIPRVLTCGIVRKTATVSR